MPVFDAWSGVQMPMHVNAGGEAFVRSAALEWRGKVRVNTVSPGWVAETLAAMGRDPANGVPAASLTIGLLSRETR